MMTGALLLLFGVNALWAVESPHIVRVFPLGGQRGAEVSVELRGGLLSNARSIEFDCAGLQWRKTTSASRQFLRGVVAIAPDAALGPHLMRVISLDGHSNTVLFNVGQFPPLREAEPNDAPQSAQAAGKTPVEIYGAMDSQEDTDVYRVDTRPGEHLAFDLRSTDIGSALECKLLLLDASGKVIARNDDRDDFDDTPYIEYTFHSGGAYYIKVDQYRGPRAADAKNNPYILRISTLPRISYSSLLGANAGTTARLTLTGAGLDQLESAHLSEVRLAEYYRMSYPYTMPLAIRPDPPAASRIARIPGRVLRRSPDAAELEFSIPPGARPGLWRLWTSSPQGISEGYSFEVSDPAQQSKDGVLRQTAQKDVLRFEGAAGEPMHFWILASQLGQPNIDTVLQLRDKDGKLLAQNDDVVSGVATLGNPDSSLFYKPDRDGPVFLTIRDRLNRGGPSFSYRLKSEKSPPSFQLFAPPDAVNAARGGVTEFKIFMAREEGFQGEVAVWIEGLPAGAEATKAKFRADQAWEPGGDNLQMIVPEVTLSIHVPASVPAGNYPIRIIGESAGRKVEVHANAMIGPLTNLFNFTRRPLPSLTLTVYDPSPVLLTAKEENLLLHPGGETHIKLQTKELPPSASVVWKELPAGVQFRMVNRTQDTVEMILYASMDVKPAAASITAEALVDGRWVSTAPVKLNIEPLSAKRQSMK